jgi:amino acid adenylation domain-containing protein
MHRTVLDYLENSSRLFPDKPAFIDEKAQVSYADLEKQTKAIGSFLNKTLKGIIKSPIAVIIDRDIMGPICFLGIIYSGNFYVPIDKKLPTFRIQLILNTIRPSAIILSNKTTNPIVDIEYDGHIFFYEDLITQSIENDILEKIKSKSIGTDPLYAIFTSGSTGTPKGVLIKQDAVVNLIENFKSIFGFDEKLKIGNQAPFDFDVSVKDIYSTLKNSGSMYILPKAVFSFPGKLIDLLDSYEINTIIWATSALRIVENLQAFEKNRPHHLTHIMFSGEVMPNKVLNYWRNHLPNALFVNLYGPTEITCNCAYFIVNRNFTDKERLPIGKPFPNSDVFLLNSNDQLCADGEIGEICVRGPSLGLGYYNNPAETAKSFCQNPLNTSYPELIYRTGDLGKLNELDELLFLSRKDFQIKHMGHRIELGELEVYINSLEFIENACCLYDEHNEKIIVFYQAPTILDKEIIIELKKSLPSYMLPNKLIHFDRLPMNKNGKIDREKLKNDINN